LDIKVLNTVDARCNHHSSFAFRIWCCEASRKNLNCNDGHIDLPL